MSYRFGELDERMVRFGNNDFMEVDYETDYIDVHFTGFHSMPFEPEPEDDYGEAISQVADISFCSQDYMTRVWDQGEIDSCVAFVVSAEMAALHAQSSHFPPVEFSKQELVDCLPILEGGTSYRSALAYVAFYGLNLEMLYRYEERYHLPCKCHSIVLIPKMTISLHDHFIPLGSLEEIVKTLSKRPLMAGILVYQSFLDFRRPLKSHFELMQPYTPYEDETPVQTTEGVLDQTNDGFVAHAVLVVGYFHGTKPSFIIKNTHGKHWGTRGYAKVATHLLSGFQYITSPGIRALTSYRDPSRDYVSRPMKVRRLQY